MNITAKDLNMIYPNGKEALKQLQFHLESPSLIGLLGPNGAGKSTLMKLLVAELQATGGQLLVDGEPMEKKEYALKQKLGYLPQSFGLYDELTVWQFLEYMSALKGIRNGKEEIERLLADTNLLPKKKSRIRNLSGGQRQRVGIAQALLGTPELLIFDEPTVGLDPEERINFRNLFSRMAQNKIVLLSTHIIEDVQSVCNQLIVMNQGSILFSGTPAMLIQRARGHVGVFQSEKAIQEDRLHITSRIHTADGVQCRIVAEKLPDFAMAAEPTLEDAYMYTILQGEVGL